MKTTKDFKEVLKYNILIGFFLCFLLSVLYAQIDNMQMVLTFVVSFCILGVWHGVIE